MMITVEEFKRLRAVVDACRELDYITPIYPHIAEPLHRWEECEDKATA